MFIFQLKPLSKAIQHTLIIGAIGLGQVITTQQVFAESTPTQQYQITATTLDAALVQFAAQAGVEISFDPVSIQHLSSHGLSGKYSVTDGFNTLLKPHGLSIEKTTTGYKLIAQNKQNVRDMGQLKTIDVTATGKTTSSEVNQLPLIIVHAENNDASVENGYVAKTLKSVGPWGEKSLQDTPYSMSVMSSDLIENTISGDLDQMFKMNPVTQSSALTTVFGYPVANIRGFGSSTGIVDGIRLSSYTYGLSTEELDRVEIMNGLTGFMYGAGNVGGTTNYIIKRPTYEKLTNLTLGNYGNQQWFGHIDLGNTIDDDGKFAYRFNAAYQDGETAKDDQNVEKRLVSGALDWHVNDDLLVQVEAAHKFWRVDRPDNRFYTSGISGWPAAFDNSKTFSPAWSYNQTESNRISMNATWDINDTFTLRSAYLYKKDIREFMILYPIYTPTGWTMYEPSKAAPYDTISQGLYTYLDAKFNTGQIKHKLTFGISGDNYQEKKFTNSYLAVTDNNYITPSGLSSEQLMNLTSPQFSQDYGPRYKATDNSNKNIIIGDEISFNDQITALVGLNYTQLNVKNYNTLGKATSSYDKSAITPTLSLIYKPVDQFTTYLSYMEGLEQGTTVPDDKTLYNNFGQVFDPYVSKQYELGGKYAFSDHLLLTSALFRIEKANSYEERTADNKITIHQDGLQVHQGLEFTLTGKVTDHLTVITGGTFMDLGIDKATDKNLEGKKPTGSASTLAKIYTEYQLPFIEGLTLSGGVYYTGSKFKDSQNLQKIEGYTLFDAGIRYKTIWGNYPTTLNLNATNLSNKDYWSSSSQLGAPRNIAFSIKTQF